ncbi:XRE family transcriptional regulator [Vibrio chagasii]|nr:XRE family transcriptional regulator [Vibrio chagasii]
MRNKHRYNKQAEVALDYFANLIQTARKEKPMSQEDLANRLNVSRSTVERMLKGDPTVKIGTYFEAAIILGIELFNMDSSRLEIAKRQSKKIESLLPVRIKSKQVVINNDF